MTPQTTIKSSRADSDQPIRRRGILAAAVAFVAGLVAKRSEAPVQASSGTGDQGFLALGSNPWYIAGLAGPNTPAVSSAPTVIQASPNFGNFVGGNGADPVLFQVDARPSGGIVDAIMGVTDGSGYGVYGSGSLGVFGVGSTTGVAGTGTFTGVTGSGNTTGVSGIGATAILGQSTSAGGFGVRGIISGPTGGAGTIAVYGQNYSSYEGPGPGAGGFGVYGLSAKGHGLVGAVASAGAAAVVGATNGVAGAYAAAFYGPVIVGGDLTVVGGAKSAAVPHPDGSHRRLYCLESPESWFEDFGTGRLECGRAEIAIDPDFAAVVDLSDYHVFLTGRGGDDLLHVREQVASGFVVEANRTFAALQGKEDHDLNGAFSWRVVAKRKDITGARLEPVTIPPAPILPPVSEIPTVELPRPRVPR